MYTEVLIFAFAFWITSKLLVDIKIDSIWSVVIAALVYMLADNLLTTAFSFLLSFVPSIPAFFLEMFVLPSTSWIAFSLTTKLASGYKVQSGAAMFWGVMIVTLLRTILGFLFM